MPRKQPPSKTLTVFQVRWFSPDWKNKTPKTKTFLKEDAASKEFDKWVRAGLRVEFYQTTHAVKLVQTMIVSFDDDRRSRHLAKHAARRDE